MFEKAPDGYYDQEAGLRLRYEVAKEFAPYVGVEWSRELGGTADFTRAGQLKFVDGVLFKTFNQGGAQPPSNISHTLTGLPEGKEPPQPSDPGDLTAVGNLAVTAPFQAFGKSIETFVPAAPNGKPNGAIYSVDPNGGGLSRKAILSEIDILAVNELFESEAAASAGRTAERRVLQGVDGGRVAVERMVGVVDGAAQSAGQNFLNLLGGLGNGGGVNVVVAFVHRVDVDGEPPHDTGDSRDVAGPVAHHAQRPDLRAAHAGALLDLLEVRLHRIEDEPELAQHARRRHGGRARRVTPPPAGRRWAAAPGSKAAGPSARRNREPAAQPARSARRGNSRH